MIEGKSLGETWWRNTTKNNIDHAIPKANSGIQQILIMAYKGTLVEAVAVHTTYLGMQCIVGND